MPFVADALPVAGANPVLSFRACEESLFLFLAAPANRQEPKYLDHQRSPPGWCGRYSRWLSLLGRLLGPLSLLGSFESLRFKLLEFFKLPVKVATGC